MRLDEGGYALLRNPKAGRSLTPIQVPTSAAAIHSQPCRLVEATPEGLRELGTIEALDSKTWNNATLAGRYLLVRNDREAVCYELPVP